MRAFKQLTLGRVVTYVVLVIWSLVCLFPIYWLGITSLKNEAAITDGPVFFPFIDFWPELRAWNFILFDTYENLQFRYVNSFLVSFTSTALTITSSALFIYGVTRFPKYGAWQADHILFVLLATRILSPLVIILPVYLLVQYAGLLDTISVLILVYTAVNLPIALWLMRPVIGAKANDQEQAARLDGASHGLILFGVLLPMLRPRILTIAILIFILCWNEYLFAVYLTSGNAMTLPPWLAGQLSMKEAQIGGEAEEWANLSAATVLMVAPLLVFANLTQKALSRFVKISVN